MSELLVGTKITLQIERLSLGGDGVGHADGVVVFVPYAAPGDTLEVELTEVQRKFARGRVLKVLESSPIRIEPPCPYHFNAERGMRNAEEGSFNKKIPPSELRAPRSALFCGGCDWQHMNYEFQLDAKRQLVEETLERIGKIETTVLPALGMQEPWRYRNKVQQPVGWDGQHIISGFYAPFSHQIMPIEDCLVQSEISVRIINRVRALMEQHRIMPYNEERHTGWLRHLWIRTTRENKALLVFVSRTEEFPRETAIVGALIQEFPQLAGIHHNVNPGKTNVILGRQWRNCVGADYLEERLGSLRYQLSPGSFFQINSLQTEVLYNQVKKLAGAGQTLLDVYCGVGAIALWLASGFRQVIGVDEVKSAVLDAQKNARLNGITNTRFVTAQAEAFLSNPHNVPRDGLTVVLDPPRAGCDPRVLQALARLRPGNLIYVSCDPGTLARDLDILGRAGYTPQTVQPVDLFPHTAHIETVVQLRPPRLIPR